MNRRHFFAALGGFLASVALPWRKAHPAEKLAGSIANAPVSQADWTCRPMLLRRYEIRGATGMDGRTVTIYCEYDREKTPAMLNAINSYEGPDFAKQFGF
jgi:hypothetical protein